MADPIIEQVTQKVFETLQTIKMSNGYNVDLIVERKQRYNRERNNLAVLCQLDPVGRADGERMQAHAEWDMHYAVVCYVVEPEGSCVSIDTRVNTVRSDVEKAIMTAFECTSDDFFGYAKLGDPVTFDDPEARWFGVVVLFTMYYRTLFTDPYSVG